MVILFDVAANKAIWLPAGLEEVEMYKNDYDYIYREQLKHFDCIKKDEQPLVSLEDGLAVQNMIESFEKIT